jgi:hypothetical protein
VCSRVRVVVGVLGVGLGPGLGLGGADAGDVGAVVGHGHVAVVGGGARGLRVAPRAQRHLEGAAAQQPQQRAQQKGEAPPKALPNLHDHVCM